MPETARRYTVQEVLELPEDGKRHELIRGELLVSPAPAPRHQLIVERIYRLLVDYLKPLGREETVHCTSADISWDEETLVQPDLFIAPREEHSKSWSTVKTLLLAVEVLSPHSSRADRVLKREAYQANGVAVYWIVDHRAGLVEVWHPEDARPEIISDVVTWRAEPGMPPLEISLASLFDRLP